VDKLDSWKGTSQANVENLAIWLEAEHPQPFLDIVKKKP
jgi:hypothetical protein